MDSWLFEILFLRFQFVNLYQFLSYTHDFSIKRSEIWLSTEDIQSIVDFQNSSWTVKNKLLPLFSEIYIFFNYKPCHFKNDCI